MTAGATYWNRDLLAGAISEALAAAPQMVADERKKQDGIEAAELQTLLANEFACYRPTHPAGLMAWAKIALLDCSPYRAAPVQAQEPDNEWRRLALQFDGHRMQAIGHLKYMVKDAEAHKLSAEQFLSAGPLSGEAVLAERIKALSPVQPVAVPDGKYGRLTGDNVAQPVQMKGKEK